MPTRAPRWPALIDVYGHLGDFIEQADIERQKYLLSTGDYRPTGSRKRITHLVHNGPPDGRNIRDDHAMKPKGSQRPVFRQRFYSGLQCWTLKPQRKPWGPMADLDPRHEAPSTGGPDI